MDLDVNRKIFASHLGDGLMDQCVKCPLERAILVPTESLFCSVSIYNETYADYIYISFSNPN